MRGNKEKIRVGLSFLMTHQLPSNKGKDFFLFISSYQWAWYPNSLNDTSFTCCENIDEN